MTYNGRIGEKAGGLGRAVTAVPALARSVEQVITNTGAKPPGESLEMVTAALTVEDETRGGGCSEATADPRCGGYRRRAISADTRMATATAVTPNPGV